MNIGNGRRIRITAAIIVAAMIAFEVFNFASTRQALVEYLGDMAIIGLRWATLLAIGFCGIDLAGIARIFTPEQGRDEPAMVYYLGGAWVVAAGFNGWLTQVAAYAAMQQSGAAASNGYAMSWVLAILVVVIRATLIVLVSHFGDTLMWGRATPVAHNSIGARPQPRYTSTDGHGI